MGQIQTIQKVLSTQKKQTQKKQELRMEKYKKIIQNATTKKQFIEYNIKPGKIAQIKIQNKQLLSQLFTSAVLLKNQSVVIPSIINIAAIKFSKQYPHSYIGLIISEQQSNGNINYVYGTGILIHNSIVLTTAQNIYCKSLHKQSKIIYFIPGMHHNKHSGIYQVMRIYYPKQYEFMEEDYEKYNFAILQLYDDLSMRYGYVGLNIQCNLKDQQIKFEGYIKDPNHSQFLFYKQCIKGITNNKSIISSQLNIFNMLSGCPLMITDENENQYVIGIHTLSSKKYCNILLTNKIKNIMNQWAISMKINLSNRKLGRDINQLDNYTFNNLQTVDLQSNQLDVECCKYLKNSKWNHLRSINLRNNHLISECCQYFASAHWICLNTINLPYNNIGDQGCKYLKSAGWIHLTCIELNGNSIGNDGCKYLVEANWPYLRNISLGSNNIEDEGCKYLKKSNWLYLRQIYLQSNFINSEGCKYVTQANWIYLLIINLSKNNIGNEGCKYLRQTDWENLFSIGLSDNNIDHEFYQYLKDAGWDLKYIKLNDNNLEVNNINKAHLLLISQLWPSVNIQY